MNIFRISLQPLRRRASATPGPELRWAARGLRAGLHARGVPIQRTSGQARELAFAASSASCKPSKADANDSGPKHDGALLSIEAEWSVAAAHHRLRVDRYIQDRLKEENRAVNVKVWKRSARHGPCIKLLYPIYCGEDAVFAATKVQLQGMTRAKPRLQRLRKAMREGNVTVNGKVVSKPGYFIKRGDKVLARIPPAVPSLEDALTIDWTPRILYEDEDVLVVDKPAGIASAPAPGEKGTHAVALLEAFLAARGPADDDDGPVRSEAIQLSNVHRLDKDTSGVLVLSKSAEAAAALGREFKGRRVQKSYWAAMFGRVQAPAAFQPQGGSECELYEHSNADEEGPEEQWNDLLIIDRGRSRIMDSSLAAAGPSGSPKPRKASLSVRVLEHIGRKVSIVALTLKTGRLHQIRVQGASRGHFVLGDNIYGEPRISGIPRLCLHCSHMALRHPRHPEKVIAVTAPLPEDLRGMVERQIREVGRKGKPPK